MMRATKGWLLRQQFRPGNLGWLVNPFYFARRELCSGLSEFFPQLRGSVLDVGCGSMPYKALVPATQYTGMEVDTPRTRASFTADIYYDGTRFPVPSNTYDAVLCSQVFEHVFEPKQFLEETCRVLRPGGFLLLAVPFVWDEHEQPYDFARYSSFGIRALLEDSGFEIKAQRKTLADGRLLFQLLNAYLYKVTLTSRPRVNRIITLILLSPVTFIGIMLGWILPANKDFYLDNIVFAQKRLDVGPLR